MTNYTNKVLEIEGNKVSWLEPTSCDTIYSLCKNKYVYKILLYYL